MRDWFSLNGADVLRVAASGVLVLVWVIAVIRVVGLRSLSKMSGFDFVVTVSIGSIVATVTATSASVWLGMVAVATLLGLQWVVARARVRWMVERVVDNRPLLLMADGELIDANLTHARVTRHDVLAKLRQANVRNPDDVLAVVLETTGDIAVLHGGGPLDDRILDGVRRRARAPRGTSRPVSG